MPNIDMHKKVGWFFSILTSLIVLKLCWKNLDLTIYQILLIPFVILTYSILPDIDHHLSRLRKNVLKLLFYSLLIVIMCFFIFKASVVIALLFMISMIGIFILSIKHRGITHNYYFMFFMASIFLFVHWFLFLMALSSGWSHIFIDRFWSGLKRKLKSKLHIKDETHIHINTKEVFKL